MARRGGGSGAASGPYAAVVALHDALDVFAALDDLASSANGLGWWTGCRRGRWLGLQEYRGPMDATPRNRLPSPAEFCARVIELTRTSDVRPSQVAHDLGVDPDTIRRWLGQAKVDAGQQEGVTTDEQAESARLRREERDILLGSRGEWRATGRASAQATSASGSGN